MGVARSRPQAMSLPDTSGVPVEVVPGDAITPACGRMSDTAPYYGGGRINNTRGGFCIAGFGVRTPSGREYILRAGHCGNPMHEFYNGDWTRSLGFVISEETAADLLLISTSDGQRHLGRDPEVADARPRASIPRTRLCV